MFKKIMVPVDLAHAALLQSSIDLAADLAKRYQAETCYVSVTANTPGALARTPEEYAHKLADFAKAQGKLHGQEVSSRVVTAPDPIADMDDAIIQAIHDTGADLVIMSTHLPKRLDVVVPSNGGKVATHTDVSVFLVRHRD
ncbi:universal stress protein [Halomonas saccharevitans]|uniref:Universal stress protein n=1 Tax=Halomonas saccharevitans TaxID=416872 RepID=A0ABU3NDK2_9GAMM|nr:universal stress protein [Halomonas saccharevitans]MDT8879256.1 universal stress protein [Halomonas saccharevitans]